MSGIKVGAAVQSALLSEADYANTLSQQFSAVTPENATKWGSLQPDGEDSFDFARADNIVHTALSNGQSVKGHTLVWHSQLPSWVNDSMSEGELQSALAHFIRTVVRRYSGNVDAWDVLNEAIADDGSGLRDTIFLEKLGPDYVEFAFTYAHAHDQNAKLYYNDYGIETINPKSDAVFAMVEELVAHDIPIDGVGMQGHVSALSAPSVDALKANFQRFVDLGLTVNLSELDVRVSDVPGDRNRRLAVQRQVYHRFITACVETPGCESVTTWGFTDKYSWVDSFYGPDDPLVFDEQYQKKPAFYGIIDGFVGVPPDDLEAAPSYVLNSSFESGAEGWSSWSPEPIESSSDQAHTGNRSGKVTGRTATWQGAVYNVAGLVRPGGFDAQVFARVAGSSSEPVGFTAQIICEGQQDFVGLASATASDTGWVELAGEVQVPDCALDALNLYVEGPALGVDLYVDDFTLREQDSGLGPELLSNNDFEVDLQGWGNWGSATVGVSSAAAHSGLKSAYISDRSNTYDGLAINLQSSVIPGATYIASGWGLLETPADTGDASLQAAISDELVLTAAATCQGESMQFIRIGQAPASDSSWTRVTGSVTVPDCTLDNFFFYVEGPQPGINFFFDDPSFRQSILSEGPNVLRNSDFEGGTSWWFGWGPTQVGVSTEAHDGLQSAIGTGRTGSWNGIATNLLTDTAIPLEPGASYTLEAWARIAGAATSDVYFTTQHVCDGEPEVYTRVATANATDTGWAEALGGLTVPTCPLSAYFLYAEGAPAGVDILIDDVTLRQTL